MQGIARTTTAAVTGFAAAVMVGATLVIATATARAAPPDPAAFIQSLTDEAISVIISPNTTPVQRRDRFRRLLASHFDLDAIARFALGRFWRTATPAQQTEYERLFRTIILESYATRFESVRESVAATGSGAPQGRVVQVQPINVRDRLVDTVVNVPGREPLRIAYRVHLLDGQWRIVDVVEEGVSLLITRRSEITAVAGRRGVAGLLATMRTQIAHAGFAQRTQAAAR